MRRIVFTGGGTGGHIIPNIALIQKLKERYPYISILYIGSFHGPETELIPRIKVAYKGIATGKLRRYFSWKNLTDFFRIPLGIFQAYKLLKKFKPHVVFSKGGYVSIPVLYAARFLKIPTVLHESDVSPGLANKIGAKKATILCLSHFESQRYFPKQKKKVVTGNPVREEILKGAKEKAYHDTGFKDDIPTILVMGGSQGAQHINDDIALASNELIKDYQIIHITGRGKKSGAIPVSEKFRSRYKAYEYVNEQLANFYKITDLIIARAGANTMAEVEALQIPAIFIPIAKKASRGEQLMNSFVYQERHPETIVIEDELLTYHSLIKAIKRALPAKNFVKKERNISMESEGTKNILDVLDGFLGESCLKKEEKD